MQYKQSAMHTCTPTHHSQYTQVMKEEVWPAEGYERYLVFRDVLNLKEEGLSICEPSSSLSRHLT